MHPLPAVPMIAHSRVKQHVSARSKEERAAEEARWQLPETTLPGPATKGDVLVLTKARCPMWSQTHTPTT